MSHGKIYIFNLLFFSNSKIHYARQITKSTPSTCRTRKAKRKHYIYHISLLRTVINHSFFSVVACFLPLLNPFFLVCPFGSLHGMYFWVFWCSRRRRLQGTAQMASGESIFCPTTVTFFFGCLSKVPNEKHNSNSNPRHRDGVRGHYRFYTHFTLYEGGQLLFSTMEMLALELAYVFNTRRATII